MRLAPDWNAWPLPDQARLATASNAGFGVGGNRAKENMDGRKPFTICDLRFLPVVRFDFPHSRLPLFPAAPFLPPAAARRNAARAIHFRPVHIWQISRDRSSPENRRGFPSGQASTVSIRPAHAKIPPS